MPLKLASLLGVAVFLATAYACSANRKKFPWRAVVWGVGLQVVLALLILRTPPGAYLFDCAQRAVSKLIGFSNEGASMVFGPLAKPEILTRTWGAGNGFLFLVVVTSTIVVVSSLSALLYHWGLLQKVVRVTAWVMQRTMGTSGSESLAAAANIFMGQTEAPLVIKPYLRGMTRSEILAMMTGGMATIAGGVLAAYVGFGVNAGHLITASVMSAPASLLIAKILLPESERSETGSGAPADVPRETCNSLDAMCRGASEGIMLSINVMAMLIAFVSLVAMANYIFAKAQSLCGLSHPIGIETVLGWLNAPFAWLMGVPQQDCGRIGQILGQRIVLNEFIGYLNLTEMVKAGQLSDRAVVITTYALCGFANFSSIAIQIGGIGSLVPERRNDLASLGVRAMVGGLLACYLTAAIVGVLS